MGGRYDDDVKRHYEKIYFDVGDQKIFHCLNMSSVHPDIKYFATWHS